MACGSGLSIGVATVASKFCLERPKGGPRWTRTPVQRSRLPARNSIEAVEPPLACIVLAPGGHPVMRAVGGATVGSSASRSSSRLPRRRLVPSRRSMPVYCTHALCLQACGLLGVVLAVRRVVHGIIAAASCACGLALHRHHAHLCYAYHAQYHACHAWCLTAQLM